MLCENKSPLLRTKMKIKCLKIAVHRLTLSMVLKPHTWFWSFLGVCLFFVGLCAIPGIGFEGLASFGRDDFTVTFDEWRTSDKNDALDNARLLVDHATDGTPPTLKGAGYRSGPSSAAPANALTGQELKERQVRDENTLVLVYDWANKTRRDANENIFTAKKSPSDV